MGVDPATFLSTERHWLGGTVFVNTVFNLHVRNQEEQPQYSRKNSRDRQTHRAEA